MFSDLVFPDAVPRGETGDAGSNEMIRRLNLQRVLSLLHYRGSHRRLEISEATGLTRSTVGMLISELARRGLVVERTEDERHRGRPSPDVSADGDRVCVIAVSAEMAGVSVALVGLGGVIHQTLEEPFPGDANAVQTCDLIARMSLALMVDPGRTITGVGVAVPGQVRVSDGVVRHAPHLGWREVPIADMLTKRLRLPVTVGNDVAAILGASWAFGQIQGEDLVVLSGRPSGIGGAIISRGRLVHGMAGYAGEWGHVPVVRPGEACVCGGSGCLETEVSLARLLAAAGLDRSSAHLLDDSLARRKPELEREVLRQFSHLEIVVRTIINSLNPRVIIFGGFLANLVGSRTAAECDVMLVRAISSASEQVEFRTGRGDSETVLFGAAELGFAALLRAPDLVPVR